MVTTEDQKVPQKARHFQKKNILKKAQKCLGQKPKLENGPHSDCPL